MKSVCALIRKVLSGLCAFLLLAAFTANAASAGVVGHTPERKEEKRCERRHAPSPPLVSAADASRIFLDLQWDMRATAVRPPLFDNRNGIEPVRKILTVCFDYFAAVEQIRKVTTTSSPEQQSDAMMRALQLSRTFFEHVRTFLNERQALSPELANYRPDPFKPGFVESSMRLVVKDLSFFFLQNGIGLLWIGPPRVLTGELLTAPPGSTRPTGKDRVAIPLFTLPKLFFVVEGRDDVVTTGPDGTQRTLLLNIRQFDLEKCYRRYCNNPRGQLRLEPGGPVQAQGLTLIAVPWVLLLKDRQERQVDSLVSKYRTLAASGPRTIALIHNNAALKLLPELKPVLSVYEQVKADPRYPHTRVVMQHLYQILICKMLVELADGEPDMAAATASLKKKSKAAVIMHELAHQTALETDTIRMLERIRQKTSSNISEADADEAEVLIEMVPRFEDLQWSFLGLLLTLQADRPWHDAYANLSFKPDLLLYRGIIEVLKKKPDTYGLRIVKQGRPVSWQVDGKSVAWLLDEEAQIVIQLDRIMTSGLISQLAQDVKEELQYDARVKTLIGKYPGIIPPSPKRQ